MSLKALALPMVLVASVLGAAAAHADAPAAATSVYELLPDPLTPGTVSTSPTITVGSGTTFDDFTFSLLNTYNTSATGMYFEFPSFGLSIDSADLTLYAGTPTSPGQEIATTGVFNPATTGETLGASLTSGNYFLQSSVTVPAGSSGAFSVGATVSAAPEPSSWALMILGVGAMGVALRRARRRNDLSDWAAAAA